MVDLTEEEMAELYDGEADFSKWVAVIECVDEIDEMGFYISPRVFWENNQRVPDWESNIDVPGFEEMAEHHFAPCEDFDDPVEELKRLGFEIVER